MEIREKVELNISSNTLATKLRHILCCESGKKPEAGRNPLLATTFNEDLQILAQEAFDEGRRYERNKTS